MAQPVTVTVGPLATADDDGACLSQKAAGAGYLVINGVKATGTFSDNSICASQTPAGAGALVLNGSLAITNPVAGAGGTAAAGAAVAYLPTPTRVYITGGSDESGKTFTVVGTVQSVTSFGPGAVVTEVITGPNASVVSSANLYSTIISITVSAATTGAITVGHSGVATFDIARRVIITSAGNDSGITFTVSGTDWAGNPRSETVTGANAGIASSVLDYLTVTSVLTSGAVASTAIVGTNGVAGSPWVRFDDYAANSQVALQCTASGTVNYTVQQTMEDPGLVTNPTAPNTYRWTEPGITWVDSGDSAVVGATATKMSSFAFAPVFSRVVLNSGSGTVTATFRQAYLN